MDPLSITASAITLIHAASAITTSLGRLFTSLRTVESRVSGLCDELVNLTSILEAVERTLKGCKVHDLAHVEGDLWRQIELALADCQITLNELGVLVNKIKDSSRAKGLGWRARAVMDLSVHGADIAAFRDRIHKSNWALQTMLHTITVSLSLRSNASQEVILFELDRLKSSINEALRASLRPAGHFSQCFESDSRVARNLRNLAKAAKQFHSAASSAASTIHGGSVQIPWRSHSGARGSLICEFPAHKREWVEMCLEQTERQSPVVTAPAKSELPEVPRPLPTIVLPPLAIPTSTETIMEDDDEEEEAEFKRLFLDGLEDLARDSIRVGDFWKAIELLKEALKREEISETESSHCCRLEVQLSLCYILEDQWRLAEPIVLRLVKTMANAELVVCNMLHAISLDYLKSYDFESALKLCRKSLQAKKRWLKQHGTDWQESLDYAETLGLLATIFGMQGEYISAEIYRRRLPPDFVYEHPANPFEFIARHRDQLQEVLGDDIPDFYAYGNHAACELEADVPGKGSGLLSNQTIGKSQTIRRSQPDNDGSISPLRTRRYEWERFESDTSKEVVSATPYTYLAVEIDLDKEPVRLLNQISPLRCKLTRIFGPKERQTPSSDEDMDDEGSPSSSTSPLTRWFMARHIFGLKISGIPLRKRSSEDESGPSHDKDRRHQGIFRLLRMEKVAHDDYFASNDVKCEHPSMTSLVLEDLGRMARGEDSRGKSPLEDLMQDRSDHQLRNGMRLEDMGRDDSLDQHSSLGHDNMPPQLAIAELPGDCVRAELPCNPVRSKRRRYNEPDQPDQTTLPLNTYSSLSSQMNAAVSSDGEAAMPSSVVPIREDRSSACEEILAAMGEEPPSSSSSPQAHPAEAEEATNCPGDIEHLDNSKGGGGSIHSQPMFPSRPDMNDGVLSTTFASLATILASIPNLKDDNARHFVRLKLGVILSRQKRLGNDDVLGYDLQRIIKSLGDGDPTHRGEGSDSASEPTNHDNIVPLEAEVECPPFSDNGIMDSKLSSERPALKRAFSWASKDESADIAVPCRIEYLDDDSLSNSTFGPAYTEIEADTESVGGAAAMLRKGDRKYAAEEAIVSRTLHQQARANPKLAKVLFSSSSPPQPTSSQDGNIKDAFRRKDPTRSSPNPLFAAFAGPGPPSPLGPKSANLQSNPPPRFQSICATNDDPFKDEVHGKAWNNENFSIAQDLAWLADNLNDDEFDDDDLLPPEPILPPAQKSVRVNASSVPQQKINTSAAAAKTEVQPSHAPRVAPKIAPPIAERLNQQRILDSSQGTAISWSSSPDYESLRDTSDTRDTSVDDSVTTNTSFKRKLEDDLPAAAAPKRRSLPFPSKLKVSEFDNTANYRHAQATTATPAPKATHTPLEFTASAVKEQRKTHRLQRMRSTESGSDGAFTSAGMKDMPMTEIQGITSSPKTIEPLFLSQEQRQILDLVTQKNQSVFFTGPAGTGKSVLMRSIIRELKKKWAKDPERLAVTASTGLAACNIGGITLHSFSGIGLGKEDVPTLVRKIRRNQKAKTRWLRTKCLIVDEISMVDAELFDKLCEIGRTIRNNGRPWGGIQLVITGDFFQLPPVPDGQTRTAKFAFDAATWGTSIPHTIGLTQVFRQRDPQFAQMLNEMRLGKISDDTVRAFRALTRPLRFDDGIETTELFPTRLEVERSNSKRLNDLPGRSYRYESVDTGDPNIKDKLLQNMMAPKSMELKVGAQVMLIKNIDEQLVNGTIGKVKQFMTQNEWECGGLGETTEDGPIDLEKAVKKIKKFQNNQDVTKTLIEFPIVEFLCTDGSRRTLQCVYDEWKVELPNGDVQAKRSQLPLILAWALSIHKAQGQTLERVKVDLTRIFEKGQAYVALSRATSQQGLQVLKFDKSKVMAHPKVVGFYNRLYSAEQALGGNKPAGQQTIQSMFGS